ncbi:MAG: 3-hydroxy-3-methylglutaryl-ACP synthase [Vallitalea sp.]|jgi:polyketide biosynthesis 3-hydroxy-3-methylglutaryl-CoA synthase-like enzyme PksG|nr:3-hydroxy-3-methylglutaryl-ACP synthase [Vallitalea sp.]
MSELAVGIEAINFYGGPAFINVSTIFQERGLDFERFNNLMMEKKSVGLPCEDPVTNAVNAAKPIIDQLTEEEKDSIDMIITSSESGLDFGKSLSTYIHDYLGLKRNLRLFEVKQACYGCTAALQMAVTFIASRVSPGAKVLVIGTDIARAAAKQTYAEPSQAVGAVALLVGENPKILEMDLGANGYYSYEVMDTCRPLPEIETGDPDLSLLSYLDCLKGSFKEYSKRVEGIDFIDTFDYLAFHSPFAGMVKGAHRMLMRDLYKMRPKDIEEDFNKRVSPSLQYCVEVGNVYSATVYLALCGLIDHTNVDDYIRVGLYSYGSGCSSEFYSGIITSTAKQELSKMKIRENLERRYCLSMEEYDNILDLNMEWIFGIEDKKVDITPYEHIYKQFFEGRNLLVLKEVNGFHREYIWS